MTFTAPDHFSYEYQLDIKKLPVTKKDCISFRLSICGIFFGMFFVLLGGYEIAAYLLGYSDESYDFVLPQGTSVQEIFWRRYTFDTFILLFGLVIVSLAVAAMRRYKKIYFDGENVCIEHKPLFGDIQVVSEHLYNYIGILLKIEYYQFGLINRNRYIIELYHKEKNKRFPLYISTMGDKVRQIWEYYAAELKMPALFITDHGLVSRHYKEFSKTLKEMSVRWHLNALYREENVPETIKYKDKAERVIIKEKRLFFDVYSVLSLLGLVILSSLIIYALFNMQVIIPYTGWGWFGSLLCLCFCVDLLVAVALFSKDVLILTDDSVILGHNTLFLRMDIEKMLKTEIEAIDIGHNPLTDRYYLSLISHDKSMVFGKNMPVKDLRWLRGAVIRAVVRETKK